MVVLNLSLIVSLFVPQQALDSKIILRYRNSAYHSKAGNQMQIKNWNVIREASARIGLFIVRLKIVPVFAATKILSGYLPCSDYQAQNRFFPLKTLIISTKYQGGIQGKLPGG